MIDGFETRENTDIPIRALVKSANGTLYKRPGASVDQYEMTKWDYDFNGYSFIYKYVCIK